MKKIAAYALLLIYLNAAAQALLPWVSDGLAHLFFWQDHLEHVHHGQVHSHHVWLEMAAREDNASAAHTPPLFFFDQDALSAHLAPTFPVLLGMALRAPVTPHGDRVFHYCSVAGDVLLPPPDATGVSWPV